MLNKPLSELTDEECVRRWHGMATMMSAMETTRSVGQGLPTRAVQGHFAQPGSPFVKQVFDSKTASTITWSRCTRCAT